MTNQISVARDAAVQILLDVLQNNAYSNLALNQYFQTHELGRADKALVTQLVYGTLRTQGTIDYILGQFIEKNLEKLPHKLIVLMRISIYQLLYMDRIPASAAVNEGVLLAKAYGYSGMSGMVNGVLRNVDRNRDKIAYPDLAEQPAEHISTVYSHPLWLVKLWLKRIGQQECIELCQYNNTTPPLALRVNLLKTDRAAMLDELKTLEIEAVPMNYSPVGLEVLSSGNLHNSNLIRHGSLVPQHQPSQLAAIALSPTAGSRVLDACAAPGGKTTHLAQIMNNTGDIVAVDIHEHKLRLIEDNCRRQGISIVTTCCADAAKLDEQFADTFDYALCDVPCSGLGVLRQRADARWQKKEDDIAALAKVGYAILESVSACVKVGGSLVYSTCTLTFDENKGNIKRFLQNNPNWELEQFADWQEHFPAQKKAGMCEIWPQQYGIDGFFIARMRRVK